MEAKRKASVRKVSASDADKTKTDSGSDAELEKEKEKEKSKDIPPKSPRGGRKKPATQIPDDFTPNQSCKAKALELGVSLNNELPKFIDHALANDRRQVDWQAAFRTWLGNSNKFTPRQQFSTGGPAQRKELTLD